MVSCPICGKSVNAARINNHLDSDCVEDVEVEIDKNTNLNADQNVGGGGAATATASSPIVASLFKTPAGSNSSVKRESSASFVSFFSSSQPVSAQSTTDSRPTSLKRSFDQHVHASSVHTNGSTTKRPFEFSSTQPVSSCATVYGRLDSLTGTQHKAKTEVVGKDGLENGNESGDGDDGVVGAESEPKPPPPPPPPSTAGAAQPPNKKVKPNKPPNAYEKAAPLAERMRPKTLDEVCGQDLVGPDGLLRGLIEQDRVPSMILWGGAGTGKTTIARVIASMVGSRFVEINSTSSGVAECKKLFTEARNELSLTGRKTIIFCDEIHRFSKSQQDVFLGPVEAGHITLIGATTENPSFKVQNALLSRCRTFTLQKLTDEHICAILTRALESERDKYTPPPSASLLNDELIKYLASFSDGDARTALNLLELAMGLSSRPGMDLSSLKQSLTKTLVYDRAGDQHYDTISAFHKAVRGSDPDAALYYLARMLQSGEDPLYIARRMIVIASEDVGLADPSLLPLATAAYTAAEKIGMPEARINLAHVAVSLCLAPKSTRVYRSLGNAMRAINEEPGVAGLPIPFHLRNAPTRLMKEIGYGREYKYNPNYRGGKVVQEYLPDALKGRKFFEDGDFGDMVDPDLVLQEQEQEKVGGTNRENESESER
ncbi:DNA-dependent ATPase mgs1 [Exophiala dermatitidis]|uniref:ATPase n=2 Tax=Exophiala dermatitidis TaxID=5970 RepID=H6C371_EXODN|nr:ATPase [Exophiala dermatitidis NIH/UT8656]KAJ4513792.1 DNA-dependent ATPase mgs1 [Exophiala dermatitidis]EHY58086.1 ATPase [Exophiala dermatitidis NIH/UT8656]KAJ4517031.1 DNA-dependent ATPase mgs1 [Exophiala dermatitidis]KAJ4519791.1 DNA-dependent ATPase mgs1 [Exophiala dermatitidis]KAJ4534406.1 DNA-dependent ATPase mgs1 [Exophiala dermatitidis]